TPFSGAAFRRVLPGLARDRHTLAPDRIGYGMSDPARGQLTMEDYATATLDALDQLGLERFDAVGIHTGALEAIELARLAPERVRRLGLVTIPYWTPEERDRTKAFLESLPGPSGDGSHVLVIWREMQATS